MRTTVIDQTGAELAGPDTPGLAAAEAREGNTVLVTEHRLLGASAGAVSHEQAGAPGILPTRGLQVTPEMIIAAQKEGMRHENPLGASAVRAMLEASLTARSRL